MNNSKFEKEFSVKIPTINMCYTHPDHGIPKPIFLFKDDDLRYYEVWIDELKYGRVNKAKKYLDDILF